MILGTVMLRVCVALATVGLAGTATADVRISASDAVEFPVETAALVTATESFFASVEADGDAARPPQISIEDGLARQISMDVADDAALSLTRPHGPIERLTGYRISWYPLDRLMGAVDFMGAYGEANLVCGYLMWDLSDPAAPVLDDVVASYLDTAMLASMGDFEAHERLLEANCAFGELAPNFSVLDRLQ